MKIYIAINMNDFHKSEKKWQGGNIESVNIKVIEAKNIELVKKHLNKDAYLIVPLNGNNKSFKYADITNN